MELFTLPFMIRALIAAFLAGLIAPAIGLYIVQRRLALLGDGLGHVAIAGVGLALATGTAPLPMAVAVCVAGAVIVELLRQSGKATGDVGFQNVSKVIMQNRPNVNMLMLDTQVYSNTGGQNSDSSTMLGGYDMNQFGVASQGKLIEKK